MSQVNWQIKEINADKLWNIPEKEPITIAVIDTSIQTNHPALNTWINKKEIPGDGIDNDKNGFIDDINGWNFGNNNNNLTPRGSHGTMVAGVIGANTSHIKGIYPGAKIMPLQLFGERIPAHHAAANAIRYAVDNGARVINNSWVMYGASSIVGDALEYAEKNNVVVIGGAGNNASNSIRTYPANFETVLSVSASDSRQNLISNSNYGWTDVAAPGANLATSTTDSGFTHHFGATSGSAAVASGAAALLLSRNPSLTPSEVRDRLIKTSITTDNLSGKTKSGGVIDVYSAHLGIKDGMISGTVSFPNSIHSQKGIAWLDTNGNDIRDKGEPFKLVTPTDNKYSFKTEPGNYSINARGLGASLGLELENGEHGYIHRENPSRGFNDVRAMRRGLSRVALDSKGVGTINLNGFNGSFFGEKITQIKVSQDGFGVVNNNDITDWGGRTHVNYEFKNPLGQNNVFAPFWDDLKLSSNGGVIHSQLNANKDRLIVQWSNLEKDGIAEKDPNSRYTFQAIFVPNENIIFNYLEMKGATNSATVGVKSDVNNYNQVLYNNDTFSTASDIFGARNIGIDITLNSGDNLNQNLNLI